MTTDKREHEAGDEILLAGSTSSTDGKWRGVCCLCPLLPAVISRMRISTWSLYTSWTLQTATPPTSTHRHGWPCIYDIKKEVIAWKEKGEGNTAIGRDLEPSESSVRTIWRKINEIHASIKA